MKNVILSTLLVVGISIIAIGQNNISKAFSASYTHAYNKDYKSAIAAMDKVFSAKSYEINFRLGWLTYMQGDFVKSQAYYTTAMQLNPKSVEAKQGYINTTAFLNKWDDVEATYKKIIVLDAKNYTANANLATYYFNKKDFKKAAKYASTIHDLYPFDYTINLLLGKINIGLGNINAAKVNLEKALLYNPSATEVLNLLKKI